MNKKNNFYVRTFYANNGSIAQDEATDLDDAIHTAQNKYTFRGTNTIKCIEVIDKVNLEKIKVFAPEGDQLQEVSQ